MSLDVGGTSGTATPTQGSSTPTPTTALTPTSTPTPTPAAATEYGKKVTNYRENEDWEIFYKGAVEIGGESRIYLIRTDRIGSTDPTKTNITTVALSRSGYNGTSDFKAPGDTGYDAFKTKYPALVQGLMYKTYSSDGTINYYGTDDGTASGTANANMQATQYLLNSNVWQNYKDLTTAWGTNNVHASGGYADYVIGAPTLELLYASYKAVYPSTEVTMPTPSGYGYTGILDSSEDIPISSSTSSNPWRHDTTSSYWLACPSDSNATVVRSVNASEGKVYKYSYNNSNYFGFRPVVCLKPGLSLVEDSNNPGTYLIQ